MSISIQRYIDIISGVGGGAAVASRQLVGRFVTKSSSLGSDEIFEANSPSAVLAKFNNDVNSNEYKRALAYFGFVNKNIKAPKMMSFVRWDVNTFRAPVFSGNSSAKTDSVLSDIKNTGTGAGIGIKYGTASVVQATFDPTAATSMFDIASLLQAGIRAAGSAQPVLAQATVAYNVASNRFIITGSTGSTAGEIAITAATAKDVAGLMGFLSGDINSVAGRVGDNAVQTMERHTNRSDNFGSFAFIDALSDWQGSDAGNRSTDVAAWNAANNNKFMFCHYVTPTQATGAWFAAHMGYAGLAVTLTQDNGGFPSVDAEVYQAQSPMEILAATDYLSTNGTQNFMYYQFPSRSFAADAQGNPAPRPGTVSDDTTANYMDAYRVNYQGITMQAGQQIAFYQRGLLMGGSTAAVDMNIYCNEMWLKDDFISSIMGFFLSMPKVSANEVGRGSLLLQMGSTIDKALNNGTISPGKPLNATQKAYITTVTADDKAWYQVQTMGYWLDATLESYVNSVTHLTEWQFKYTLVYSKDDVVRKVTGSDILI